MSGPLDAALALHGAGALADAQAAYRRILADHPAHVEAQHYLGVLSHQLGDSTAGIALILRSLELESASASRYNDLGNILVQLGDLDNAATAFGASTRIVADDANVWNNLASVLHRQGDRSGAERAYRQALDCDGDFAAALANLAALLAEDGREEESSLLSCRAFVLPPLEDKPAKMLAIAYYRLGRIAEAAECYRAWLRAEPGNAVALHHLAACTGEAVPPRASNGFLISVFDDMAEGFDEKLVNKLDYRGPAIIGGLLAGHLQAQGTLDVLDGGCGTGLCAPVLSPYARRLTGVDLSSAMLAKARECALYDALDEAELTAYLQARREVFDLVVMADTLIYFGDLTALFGAVAGGLRPGGAFAFTVELAAEAAAGELDYRLDFSGRYAHSARYLAQVLGAAGFAVLSSDGVELRSEFCKPAPGLAVLARRAPR